MSTHPDLDMFQSRLADLTQTITDIENAFYNRDLRALSRVDFGALERDTEKICSDITRMGNPLAHQMQPAMEEFIARLNDIEHHLNDFKDQIRSEAAQ